MGRSGVMAVVLVFLVMHTNPAKAIDCSSIFSCSTFLKDPNPTSPPPSNCCNSATYLLTLGDVNTLCQCLAPLTSGFLRSKAQQIPSLCNLPSFSAIVPCVAPSSGVVPESFLPPIFSFPPIFPFPPFIPFTPEVPAPPPTKA